MNRSLFFIAQDIKIAWRDSSNRVFLALPILLFVLLNTILEVLLEAYPAVQAYSGLLLSAFVVQGGILFGFVGSFMLLDEKDQGLFPVFQVAPVSMSQLLLTKLAFPFGITLVYALLSLGINPVHSFSGIPLLLSAVSFALLSPMAALLIAALGKNKVEGLTYFKMVDMLFLAPAAAFFLPEAWKYLFMVLPTYWTFAAVNLGLEDLGKDFYLYELVSIAFQSAIFAFSLWFFKRRL